MSNEINEIAVQLRSDVGYNKARRARKAGQVPAVVYGKGLETKAIYVSDAELGAVLRNKPEQIFLVDGDNKQQVVIKELQKNRLKDFCLHVDFMVVG